MFPHIETSFLTLPLIYTEIYFCIFSCFGFLSKYTALVYHFRFILWLKVEWILPHLSLPEINCLILNVHNHRESLVSNFWNKHLAVHLITRILNIGFKKLFQCKWKKKLEVVESFPWNTSCKKKRTNTSEIQTTYRRLWIKWDKV